VKIFKHGAFTSTMMDETTHVWLAFHSVSEQEQKDWLHTVISAIRDQDRQIEFYKHAWQTLVHLKPHINQS
tara:strand:- start:15825 stop:16037 length:213 start_codon:yes stop_codon:yes gene_type:complete